MRLTRARVLPQMGGMIEGPTDEARLAAAALHWLVDAGCSSLVGDQPASWFQHGSSAEQPDPRPAERVRLETPNPTGGYTTRQPAEPNWSEPRTALAPASVSVAEAAAEADALAGKAATLDDLYAAIEAFEGCSVKATANKTVIFDGNPESRVMIIGEAPGAEEDRQGKPFVGAAGQLLDRMLASIGRDRTSAYITNVFFWRPPGNRTPTPQEIALCQPFVRRHVELLRPKAILSLGGVSAKALLESDAGITRLRGQWKNVTFGTVTVPVLATFHPAYLLRQPAQKGLAWRDLLAFKARLEGEA